VACVDFSDTSQEVVKQALRVAGQDHSELHFLHVFQAEWNNWSSPDRLSALADFEKGCSTLLEGNLRQFVDVPAELPAFYTVTQSKTHGHGIAEYCRRVEADLVVLGSRGRTTLKYILLGSTVERLLKEIPCSVLVVRPPGTAAETGPASTSGEKSPAI